ncbi:kexin [Saccharomycopsis crataegensis]|uniref:Kexin n=1 Tax=Saccharomycopsis crataegensis TaxID=43959 RepID=A0AAV5QP77_9ASCO|nr:kexin [Saccharomycopsis crataegensis]
MRVNSLFGLLLFFLARTISSESFQDSIVDHHNKIPERDYDLRDYFTVELQNECQLRQFIDNFPDFNFEHEFRGLDNHYVFSTLKSFNQIPENAIHGINDQLHGSNHDALTIEKRSASSIHKRLASDLSVKALHLLEPRKLEKRAPIPQSYDSSMEPVFAAKEKYNINDPEFIKQWHIVNPVSPNDDVNVTGVWDLGITGKNITVAIIDDGLDFTSDDLRDAFNKEASWDYNANQNLPMPTLDDDYHGTRCAGEIAAQKNEFCGVGVAMGSKVSGLRILSGKITAEDEAAALMYRNDLNDIYSCSWGPPDDGASMQAPPLLVQKSIVKSVLDGRGGKGSLYVFASGNGGFRGDSCNFDGYTNSIYSITVGAIDWHGKHPSYSEACAAVLTVTYSSGSGEHIHTTDIKEQCSDHHGGTSAAAPLAAGIYALVLEANPDLTWRDVQYITILSGVEINEDDGEWQDCAVGKRYSHKYGFGKIDAYKMVELAKTWTNVKPQAWHYSQRKKSSLKVIGGGDAAFNDTISIDAKDTQNSNLEKLEHVTVTVDIDTTSRSSFSANLISPSGRKSRLAIARQLDTSSEGFKNWTFMSVAHWGEDPAGEWTLELMNHDKNNDVTLNSWRLQLFGPTIDATKAKRFPLPGDEEEPEVQEDENKEEESGSDSETKPEGTEADVSNPENEHSHDEDEDGKFRHDTTKHYGEYFFLLIVIGFCICLFYLKAVNGRRPHRRRAEDYEFDIINPESDDESRYSATSPRFDYDSDNASLLIDQDRESQEVVHNVEDFEIDSGDENDYMNGQDKNNQSSEPSHI